MRDDRGSPDDGYPHGDRCRHAFRPRTHRGNDTRNAPATVESRSADVGARSSRPGPARNCLGRVGLDLMTSGPAGEKATCPGMHEMSPGDWRVGMGAVIAWVTPLGFEPRTN